MFPKLKSVIKKIRLCFFFPALIILVGPAFAQNNFEKAKEVLSKAVEAYGGEVLLRKIKTVEFKMDGFREELDQSFSTFPPYNFGKDRRIYRYDFTNQTGFNEIYISLAGGLDIHFRTVVNENEKFSLNLKNKTIRPDMGAVSSLGIELRIPPLLIRSLVGTPTDSLEYIGTNEVEGKLHDHLVSTRIASLPMNLYFDSKTHLLTKVDFEFFDNIRGDIELVRYFDLYHPVDGTKAPSRFRLYYDGELFLQQYYSYVDFNKAVDPKTVTIPEGYREIIGEISPEPLIKKLADNVYLIDSEAVGFNVFHGYNVFFVEMDDYIVVVDTPINSANSKKNIALIKKTIPDKPIKYAIPTHHHADHAGGLRQYVFEEATIVSTSRNQPYFEKMFAYKRSNSPDDLDQNPKESVFKIVDDRIIFSDGPKRLEIINIGPVPHAEDLFIAYIPEEKLIFAADSYFSPRAGGVVAADDQGIIFARKIKELGLDIETIVQSHGLFAPIEELLESIEIRKGEDF